MPPSKKLRLELDEDDDVEGGGLEEATTSKARNHQQKLNTDNSYARSYDTWRRKEELAKLKGKYGDDVGEDDDDEESESSESEPEWTNGDEEAFLATLGALKSNDPQLYDEQKRFFDGNDVKVKQPKKEGVVGKKETMYLRDYERKLVTERGGRLSDDDDEDDDEAGNDKPKPSGYYAQQERLKAEIKAEIAAANQDDDADDLLVKRKKTKEEEQVEEDDYRQWLREHGDNELKSAKGKELQALRKAWTDPTLEAEEKFLRDYVLDKKYEVDGGSRRKKDNNSVPTYDEIVGGGSDPSEEEQELEKEDEFERKFNFRFEEPDQDFIKQYPRTVAVSVRKPDTRRKEQRERRDERKKREKSERTAEIAELRRLKRAEIDAKLQRLKKLAGASGVQDIALTEADIDGDFDPAEYDRRMKELFSSEYYDGETADQEKPVFSDSDEEKGEEGDDDQDEDDVDYDNLVVGQHDGAKDQDNEDEDEAGSSMARRKQPSARRRKRNSRFLAAVERPKPKFDPNEKTFEEYFNEYYALDYEDLLGDLRTRFKYRPVPANDFGLSASEILDADDRQLNAWVSLKKVTAYRNDDEEAYDQKMYARKAKDADKKSRILTMDFGEKKTTKKKKSLESKESVSEKPQQNGGADGEEQKETKKKRRRQKKKTTTEKKQEQTKKEAPVRAENNGGTRKRKRKSTETAAKSVIEMDDARLAAYGLNPKRVKAKAKFGSGGGAAKKKITTKKNC